MNAKAIVTERIQQAYRSMNEADLESLMTLFTPDAILQNPGAAPIVGLAALRAFWSKTLSQFSLRVEPAIDDVDDLGVVIAVRGNVRGAMIPVAGGAEVTVDSWFHQLYRKHPDGSVQFWRGANGPNSAPTSVR